MLDVKTRFLNILAAWLALSSALEMFRDIVVNNIDTYKGRGSLTRRKHVDLNHELMQSSVVPNPHTGEKPRRQNQRRAFRKGKCRVPLQTNRVRTLGVGERGGSCHCFQTSGVGCYGQEVLKMKA